MLSSKSNNNSIFKRFIVLVICAFLLMLLDTRVGIIKNGRSVLSVVTAPFYSLVNIPNNISKWSDITFISKQQIQSDNEKLLIENRFLKVKFQKYNQLLYDIKKLNRILKVETKYNESSFEIASVIDVKQSRIKKQIVIDKGTIDKAFNGQMVIGENGVIGYIHNVGVLKSKVLLVSDPVYQAPVKNQRNGLRGILAGKASVKNGLRLKFMPNEADVKVGDIFITSYLSKKYLDNFPVAKVVNIVKNEQQDFMEVELEAIEKLLRLDTVLLLLDKKRAP